MKSNNLSLNEAIDVAQNRPLYSVSQFSEIFSQTVGNF